jgi:predicted NBD/HSP70 family sugar kinase
MPKATLAALVGSLIELGLVAEGPGKPSSGANGPRRAGRPAKVLALAGPSPVVGTVVFSGGVVCAAVVSYEGSVLGRAQAVLGAPDADFLAPGVDLLSTALYEAGPATEQLRAVVIGVPAPVAPAGLVRRPATDSGASERGLVPLVAGQGDHIRGVAGRLADELERRLGVPSVVENDANLGALGEATFGAGRGVDSFVYLKLARGVGAGLVVAGRLHRGETGFAGELGHVHVRDDGPLCACGGRGCLHGILGDALVQAVQPAYEQPLTFRDVLELAAGGDAGPRRVLEDVGRTLGRPLADFATLFNPGAIIVDGSFAPAADHVVRGIREALDRYAAPVAAQAVSVRAGALGDDADVLGGAALARVGLAALR